MIYSHGIAVIASDSIPLFGVLQSRIHETWARFFASSMKDDIRYTPSSCFDSFPRPIGPDDTLFRISDMYFQTRSEMMAANDEGLTKTYNRFHDPHETSPEIKKLRDLHDEMDQAVLRAYGWDDLAEQTTCEFLLDYVEEEDDDPTAKKSNEKKPWRYRWPDEFRDEVLARLLELNEQRAMEEKLAGKTADAQAKKAAGSNSKGRKSSRKKQEPELFE